MTHIEDRQLTTLTSPLTREPAAMRGSWAIAGGAALATAAAVLTTASLPHLAPWTAILAMGTVGLATVLMLRRANETARAAAVLHELARIEPESGLPGPRVLWTELANALEASRRDRKPLTVVMVSFGEMRELHHERGLPAGQRVVRQAAQALHSAALAYGGSAFRVHGQALCALLPGTPEAEAIALASRLEPALALLSRKNGGLVSLVAGAAPAQGGDLPDDVLLRAERACTRVRTLLASGITPRTAMRYRPGQ